jgi:hypothetical protein
MDDDTKEEEQISQEIHILKRCNHPNIVAYFGSCWSGNDLWVGDKEFRVFVDQIK